RVHAARAAEVHGERSLSSPPPLLRLRISASSRPIAHLFCCSASSRFPIRSLNRVPRLEDYLGMASQNSFNARTPITVGADTFHIFSLPALEKAGFPNVSRLPYSLKILLENLLRREDARFVDPEDIQALAGWDVCSGAQKEIAFTPAR